MFDTGSLSDAPSDKASYVEQPDMMSPENEEMLKPADVDGQNHGPPENELMELTPPDIIQDSLPPDTTHDLVLSLQSSKQPPIIRKTNRQSKPLIWIKGYVVPTKSSPYSINNHVSYHHLSDNYQNYVKSFSVLVEPQCFQEASQDQRWI